MKDRQGIDGRFRLSDHRQEERRGEECPQSPGFNGPHLQLLHTSESRSEKCNANQNIGSEYCVWNQQKNDCMSHDAQRDDGKY